jgi:hypothetical protein
MKQAIILILSFYFSFSSFAETPPLLIVKDYQANAVIVLSESPSGQVRTAARTLQSYIQKSTNAVLPITTSEPVNTISIEIGLTNFAKKQGLDFTNLDEDAFVLRTVDSHHFIIVGGSDWGTEFGVYSFLERFVGIHWLMPTEIGTDVPSNMNLTLPDIGITDSPEYISRQISPLYPEDGTDLGNWARFNRLRGRINFSHNLSNLFKPKHFLKTNPDFYPKNGKDLQFNDYSWQPNFSAPGIADSAAAVIIRYFHKNPKATSYSLGINDFPAFDQSAHSLARRKGGKNYLGMEDVSNDYFQWVDAVVKKVRNIFPNKYFGLLAYNNVAEPPSPNIGVSEHVVPFLTYERLRWSNPKLQQKGHQVTQAWAKECDVLGWYDYVYGLDYLIPRVWFHEMKDYLKWGSQNKVQYYYAELYPNWGEGPKPWVLGKLLWNPNRNVDSLLNVWYVAAAGAKAAPKLKAYYDLWEQFWAKDIFKSSWNNDNGQFLYFPDLSYLIAVPESFVKQCDILMNAALKLAATFAQKERVSELRDMWQLYKVSIQIYNDPTISQDQKQQNLISSPKFISLLNNLANDPIHANTVMWIKNHFSVKG